MKRVVYILLILIVLLFSICNVTKATSIDDIIRGAENFIDTGKQSPEIVVISKDSVTEVMDFIYNTLLVVGVIAVIVTGTILGIKYMTSSVEGQAKIKETLIPFIVGSVVIFGSFFIWKLIVNVLTGLE